MSKIKLNYLIKLFSALAVLLYLMPSTEASVYQPQRVWNKAEIRLCYAPWTYLKFTEFSESLNYIDIAATLGCPVQKLKEFSAGQKAFIQKVITVNYQESEVGIHFVGFEACPRSAKVMKQNFDAMVITVDQSDIGPDSRCGKLYQAGITGQGSIGNLFLEQNRMSAVILGNRDFDGSAKLSAEETSQLKIVHEFGHLTAMRHEHVRSEDALGDLNCRMLFRARGVTQITEPQMKATWMGSYDPNSVMNYCGNYAKTDLDGVYGRRDLGLSDGDKAVLRSLYCDKGNCQ